MIFNNPRIISVFSRRPLNMSLNYGSADNSLANRRSFLNPLGIDYKNLVCAKQVHGVAVKLIGRDDLGRGALDYNDAIEDTDAFITNEKNIPLAIFTADCLSVFLYDSQNHAAGLVHAGWRSAKSGILTQTIKLMQNEFHSRAGDIEAGFGPCIRQCCYEVQEEFKNHFDCGIIKKEDKLYFDLAQINRKQLLKAGLRQENIFDQGICTSCRNDEFFSFRKEGVLSGRMMSIIMLK